MTAMESNEKNCLMVLDNPYSPDHRPRREIETLRAAGWRVVMLCEQGPGLPPVERKDGVEVHRIVPPWRSMPFTWKSMSRARDAFAYVQASLRGPFQVVHCHDWLTLPFARRLARQQGAKLVYDSHEYFAGIAKGGKEGMRGKLRHKLRLWRESRGLRHASLLITVSPTIGNWFRERRGFRKPVLVLNNMPDWNSPGEPDRELRQRLGVEPEALLLVHAGNIRFNSRRIDVVVKALGEVPHVHLLCVGDGEDQQLAALSRAAGVAQRVHHMPSVPYRRLGDVLAACDVGLSVLNPGVLNHEAALPNKLFEYLASGLPVLGSPIREQRRFLEAEGIGWTMAELTPEACAAALRQAREELAAVRENVARRRDRYIWSSQDEMLVSNYEELLK